MLYERDIYFFPLVNIHLFLNMYGHVTNYAHKFNNQYI